jgi:hypothetical protein
MPRARWRNGIHCHIIAGEDRRRHPTQVLLHGDKILGAMMSDDTWRPGRRR